MCGITGIWKRDGAPVMEHEITAITYALRHRGPDGQGIYIDPTRSLALGHRRLAILDLTPTGQQPMSYADGRYWLTFNGEIYNFVELREELRSAGHKFVSESDSEVILAAYLQWGPACQQKFNGMWALAIWDRKDQQLFLSRDRFGIKPLYYLVENRWVVFASEYKAFLALPGFGPRINYHRLRRSLVDPMSAEDGSETLLDRVFRLPAGCHAFITRDQIRVERWWSTLDHLVSPPTRLVEQAEHLRELLRDACALRMRSDVPIGTCLSGGLDSSSILCTLAAIQKGPLAGSTDRLATDWQRAFTAVFPGSPIDEEPFADQAATHSGASIYKVPITPSDATDHLENVVFQMEDLYISLPTALWMTYRELRREQVVVSLDGHGADELLGGYPHYAFSAARGLRPWQLGTLARNLAAMSPNGIQIKPRGAITLWLAQAPGARPLHRVWKGRLLHPNVLLEWLAQEAQRSAGREARLADTQFRGQPITRALYEDFHVRILPNILRQFDRSSMAHGIEVRMPFMDWRLVAYAFSLPDHSKLGAGYTKLVLREAVKDLVPDALRLRKTKVGFNSPMVDWFRGALRPWIEETTSSTEFLQSDLWDGPQVRRFVSRHMDNGWSWGDTEQLWPILQAHLWQKLFIDRKGPAKSLVALQST